MTDTQSYETVRRTTVRRLAPKPALAKPIETPQPVEAPAPQPRILVRFEIIGNPQRAAELVLCEGIMPRQLAETLKRFAEAWYTA